MSEILTHKNLSAVKPTNATPRTNKGTKSKQERGI